MIERLLTHPPGLSGPSQHKNQKRKEDKELAVYIYVDPVNNIKIITAQVQRKIKL